MFGIKCGYAVKTPGEPHLWEVNENAGRLDTEKVKVFHLVAAKILYVTKWMRPDIKPELTYFKARVANSNMDDWKKIKHCITFLNQSKEDKQSIGCLKLK